MSPEADRENFVPALAYRFLTPLYDPVIRLTTRERRFKRALIERAGIRPGMHVLDVGCGTGTLTIWAKEQVPGADFIGLDGDPQMLSRAELKAKRASVKVSFAEGMSFDLPFADRSFDRVISSLFFHHLIGADKRRTFQEIRRVMPAGGQLHIADWGRPQDRLMKAMSYSIRTLDGVEQTQDNLDGSLSRLVEDAGFEPHRDGPSFRTVYGTMQLFSFSVPD